LNLPCEAFVLLYDGIDIIEVINSIGGGGKFSYNVRMIEADAAVSMGIRFDETWYSIPKRTREYMIAVRSAKQWIESISSYEASMKG
jgi:hypothetical protein